MNGFDPTKHPRGNPTTGNRGQFAARQQTPAEIMLKPAIPGTTLTGQVLDHARHARGGAYAATLACILQARTPRVHALRYQEPDWTMPSHWQGDDGRWRPVDADLVEQVTDLLDTPAVRADVARWARTGGRDGIIDLDRPPEGDPIDAEQGVSAAALDHAGQSIVTAARMARDLGGSDCTGAEVRWDQTDDRLEVDRVITPDGAREPGDAEQGIVATIDLDRGLADTCDMRRAVEQRLTWGDWDLAAGGTTFTIRPVGELPEG